MCPKLPITGLRSTKSAHARDLVGRHASNVPLPLSDFAGVWEGALYRDGSAVGLPFSLLQSVVADASRGGGGVGRVAFAGRDDSVAADVTLLEASAATYVALVGPYYDAAFDAQVVMLLDARRSGDRMTGSFRVRVVAGGGCVDGRFVAVKSRRAAAA